MADIKGSALPAATSPTGFDAIGVQGGVSKKISRALLVGNGVFNVEDYGAVGDGVTDDTLALRDAIDAAGVNGVLLFKPGKTYALSGSITPLAGQTLSGYGAKLKRLAEIKSATATAITTAPGAKSITVSNGSLFRVGMHVSVYNGSDFDASPHLITNIVGNILTVGTNFTTEFPSGGTVITAFSQVYASLVPGIRILGLEFDGNRGNNTSLAKWQLHSAIVLYSDRGLIEDCYIHDEVSEGTVAGGLGVSVRNNAIIDCGGNGIHFSGCTGAEASGNYIKNTNILGVATGHADGLICFSNGTEYTHIVNNYLDTGISGVSALDSDDNSSVVITGNIIRNCTSSAIEGIFPSGTTGGKVVISNNLIYDSVILAVNFTQTFSPGSGPYSVIISNNYLSNTALLCGKGVDLSVQGNILKIPDTTSVCVEVKDCKRMTCAGNQVTGGLLGIYVNGANCDAVKISGNTYLNNYVGGISVEGDVAGRANSVEGCTVVVESGYVTAAGYIGIRASNNLAVLNNVMNIQTTSSNAAIECPNGSSGVNGAIVQGNVIRSAGLAYAIRAYGGSQNNFIVGNYTQQSIQNGGGGSNTVTGNYTIY